MFRLTDADRAASPVIAVVLLVAITVMLSGMVLMLGTSDTFQPTDPGTQSAISSEVNNDRVKFTVDATTSNTTYHVKVNDQTLHEWDEIRAGQTLRVSCLNEGDTVRLVEYRDEDTTTVLQKYEIDEIDAPNDCPAHALFEDEHPATNDFESGTSGWGTSGNGEIHQLQTDNAYTGNHVLEVTADPDNSWSGAYTEFGGDGTLAVEPGETYTFIGWVYIPEGTDLQGDMEFHKRVQSADGSECCHAYTVKESHTMIRTDASEGEWIMRYYVITIDEDIDDPVARLSVISYGDSGAEGPIYTDGIRVAEGDRVYDEDE